MGCPGAADILPCFANSSNSGAKAANRAKLRCVLWFSRLRSTELITLITLIGFSLSCSPSLSLPSNSQRTAEQQPPSRQAEAGCGCRLLPTSSPFGEVPHGLTSQAEILTTTTLSARFRPSTTATALGGALRSPSATCLLGGSPPGKAWGNA